MEPAREILEQSERIKLHGLFDPERKSIQAALEKLERPGTLGPGRAVPRRYRVR